jgi:hypothetical protein
VRLTPCRPPPLVRPPLTPASYSRPTAAIRLTWGSFRAARSFSVISPPATARRQPLQDSSQMCGMPATATRWRPDAALI